MLKNFRDKIALSGVTVLSLGIALLIFTFISAYGFLTESFNIIATQDLVQTFGEALAPLIATCIRIMYLGVMGWIASLITIRGVTLITNSPKLEIIANPQKAEIDQPTQSSQKTKEPKKESKTVNPELTVLPPEEATQPRAH